MPNLPLPFLASPIIRRVAWHIRRVGGQLDRRFFITLVEGILAVVAIAAVLITLLEKKLSSNRSSTRSTGGSPRSSAKATPPS